jgi:translation initiation factor 2 alpha subunit (eIF-2alpha)
LKAEKIIEMASHSLKTDYKALYAKVWGELSKSYFYIYQAFDDFLNGNLTLANHFDKTTAETLEKIIREKIRPKEILVGGDITINTWEENGVEDIKKAFSQITSSTPATGILNQTIQYLGGGKYRVLLKGTDYKLLEKYLKDSTENVISFMKKKKAKVEYERVKNLSAETASA